MDHSEEWTVKYDEPDKKVRYKYEGGTGFVSALCECIIDAPLVHVMSLYSEVDLFLEWFPSISEATKIREITDHRALFITKQKLPWPMWDREVCASVTGMFDRKNKGVLMVLKSVQEGQVWFGQETPMAANKHVRVLIIKGYHYFQYISENQTRYVTISNSDPQFGFRIPNWLLNYMTGKVCYQMLTLMQKKAKEVPNLPYMDRINQRRKFYSRIEEGVKSFQNTPSTESANEEEEKKDEEHKEYD